MPTNPLFSRLENFFSSYEEENPSADVSLLKSLQGWRWECDSDAKITSCSAEIEEILNIPEASIIGQTLHSFAISEDSGDKLKSALLGDTFPVDIDIDYIPANGNVLKTRVQIFSSLHADGKKIGWRGYTQLLSEEDFSPSAISHDDPLNILQSLISKPNQPDEPSRPARLPRDKKRATGFLPQISKAASSAQWSETGKIIHKTGSDTDSGGASISHPVVIGDSVSGVLEILDANPNRKWSKENQLLVQEVAAQLSLALENAELYSTVQRELGDRVRAEEETQKRNQDLASLNQIGQQLNALTNSEDIFAYLEEIIPQLISTPNLTIAVVDDEGENISFPVSIINYEASFQQARPLSSGPIKYILDFRQPLLINSRNDYHQYLSPENAPSNPPKSLLAVPMIVSEKSYGAILLENFESENQFSEVDLELLSTRLLLLLKTPTSSRKCQTRSQRLKFAAATRNSLQRVLPSSPNLVQNPYLNSWRCSAKPPMPAGSILPRSKRMKQDNIGMLPQAGRTKAFHPESPMTRLSISRLPSMKIGRKTWLSTA